LQNAPIETGRYRQQSEHEVRRHKAEIYRMLLGLIDSLDRSRCFPGDVATNARAPPQSFVGPLGA